MVSSALRRDGSLSCLIRYAPSVAIVFLGMSFIAPASGQDTTAFGQRVTALIFGEIDYREREDLGDDGFVIGQGVAQFNVRLDDRLSVFTEMTATARKDESFDFSIERLFVRYEFSDNYKLSAGRYHTPLGYWNSSFHHGSWLQTTVSRPQTVKFGSNVVPIHFVGATRTRFCRTLSWRGANRFIRRLQRLPGGACSERRVQPPRTNSLCVVFCTG